MRADGSSGFNGGVLRNGESLGEVDLRGSLEGSSISRLTLLGGLSILGEDDKLVQVGQKSLLVELQRLLRAVATTMVNSDSNGSSVSLGQASSLNT